MKKLINVDLDKEKLIISFCHSMFFRIIQVGMGMDTWYDNKVGPERKTKQKQFFSNCQHILASCIQNLENFNGVKKISELLEYELTPAKIELVTEV